MRLPARGFLRLAQFAQRARCAQYAHQGQKAHSARCSQRTRTGAIALLACAFTLFTNTPEAAADVVDEAFVAGNAEARAGSWEAAIARYREAEGLLPGRSATLSYNLGTAYAQRGDLGHATYHLRRALQPEAEPGAALIESTRRNLGIVRKRIEVAAETSGAQVDRAESWWELVLVAIRAPLFAWLALGCGWLALAVHLLGRRLRGPAAAGARSLTLVLVALFVVLGGLHGLAERAERQAPPAIVLPATAEVREAPGIHRASTFTLQGGSRVRIVERAPGWSRVRLAGGLGGWLPTEAIGEL